MEVVRGWTIPSEAKRSCRSNKPSRLFSLSASTRQPQPHVSRILHEIPILQAEPLVGATFRFAAATAAAAVLQYCFLDWDVAGKRDPELAKVCSVTARLPTFNLEA